MRSSIRGRMLACVLACGVLVGCGGDSIAPATGALTVLDPNGGEALVCGTTVDVTWDTASYAGNVDVEYSTDGGAGWSVLVANTVNDGHEAVTAPGTTSTTVRVQVSAADGDPSVAQAPADQSDGDFALIAGIEVTNPNGGETWTEGLGASVTWASAGFTGNVDVEYSTNGGVTWLPLVAGTANDGIQDVTVPGAVSSTVRVQVSAADGDPSVATAPVDQSDADFEIVARPDPGVAEEYWYVSMQACMDDIRKSSTSWGTATLWSEGAFDLHVTTNVYCGSAMLGPTLETGGMCVVDDRKQLEVLTAGGETGEGQISEDDSFISLGLTSAGSSPTVACMLKKESGHTTASMAGEWWCVWVEQYACTLITCRGTATFDGSGGWSALFTSGSTSYGPLWNTGREVSGAAYAVGEDGSLALTGVPAMGGVGSGGNIAIAAGDPTGGTNQFLLFIRPTDDVGEALSPDTPPEDARGSVANLISRDFHAVVLTSQSFLGNNTGSRQWGLTATFLMCGGYNTQQFPIRGTLNENGAIADLADCLGRPVYSADSRSLICDVTHYPDPESAQSDEEDWWLSSVGRFSTCGQVGIFGGGYFGMEDTYDAATVWVLVRR